MSFNFNQVRKDSISINNVLNTPNWNAEIGVNEPTWDTYLSNHTVNNNYITNFTEENTSILNNVNINFKQAIHQLSNSNALESGSYYFFKFSFKRIEQRTMVISIYLKSSTNRDISQLVGTYNVGAGTGEVYIEKIIAPNFNYDTIEFDLQRGAIDLQRLIAESTQNNNNGTTNINYVTEDFVVVTKAFLTKINNLLNAAPFSTNKINKLGVEGTPGMLMCINGQEIRIPPSGIFEIKNGYEVSFLSFIFRDTDYFIVNYQYQS